MAQVTRWWWVAAAPITSSGVYIGQRDEAPVDVDASIFELLSTIIPIPKLVYTSPLQRAAIVANALHGLKKAAGSVVEIDAFSEQHFGTWEGKTFKAVQDALAEHPTSHEAIADLAPEGGESFSGLITRTQLAIDTIGYQIAEAAPSGPADVLCAAHISTIRAAVAKALDLKAEQSLKIHLQPLSLTVLEHHEHMGWLTHTTGWTPWPMVR